ncbi:MAG: hypothetical protein RLP44_27695 [Aggregatilineales bacterium]
MSGLVAKISAIITFVFGGLIFLALVGGENVATGWQINVASRTRDGYWAYERIDIDRRMTYRIPLSQVIRSPPLFSPDGNFAVIDTGATHELVDLRDDTTITELSGVGRIWSPDSRYLSFLDNVQDSPTFGAFLTLPIDENSIAGDPLPVTIDGGNALTGYARWSPDSQKMAFLAYNQITSELLIADADGSNARRLTPTITRPQTMAWSPDGEQIAVVWTPLEDNAHLILSRVNIDGTGLETITPTQENTISRIEWSPDGERIAYIALPGQELFVVDVASGQITVPIDYNLGASTISWSPDSTQIAFLSARDSDFYAVRRDGRNVRRLTNTDNLNVLMP